MNTSLKVTIIGAAAVIVCVCMQIFFSPFRSCVREFSAAPPDNANATCLQIMSPKDVSGRAAAK